MVCLLPEEQQIALKSKEELVVTHLHIHPFSLSHFCISPTIWHPTKDTHSSRTTTGTICLQQIDLHTTNICASLSRESNGQASQMASHPPHPCLPSLLLSSLSFSSPSSSSVSMWGCSIRHLRQKNTVWKGGIPPALPFSVGSDVGCDLAQMLLLLSLS